MQSAHSNSSMVPNWSSPLYISCWHLQHTSWKVMTTVTLLTISCQVHRESQRQNSVLFLCLQLIQKRLEKNSKHMSALDKAYNRLQWNFRPEWSKSRSQRRCLCPQWSHIAACHSPALHRRGLPSAENAVQSGSCCPPSPLCCLPMWMPPPPSFSWVALCIRLHMLQLQLKLTTKIKEFAGFTHLLWGCHNIRFPLHNYHGQTTSW